ncbi:hypothetical protein [Mycobacterium sp.]|uniref:hypothetical protein n=1 Tax=Mycobacterium sp. TaxID=1785 RepID=UPI0031DF2BAB
MLRESNAGDWIKIMRTRGTATVSAIGAGANVEVVQRLVGYATATMTPGRWGRLRSDGMAGVTNALGKAIDSVAASLLYSEADCDEAETISAAS